MSVTVVTDLQVLWLCLSEDLRFLSVGLVGRWWEWFCSGNCCELILYAVLKIGVSILLSLPELAFSSATHVLRGTTVAQLLCRIGYMLHDLNLDS